MPHGRKSSLRHPKTLFYPFNPVVAIPSTLGSNATHFKRRLANSGENGHGQISSQDVVKADNGKICGDGEAALLRASHQVERHLVANGKDGGKRLLAVKELGARLVTTFP
jgi:hypothetical protein